MPNQRYNTLQLAIRIDVDHVTELRKLTKQPVTELEIVLNVEELHDCIAERTKSPMSGLLALFEFETYVSAGIVKKEAPVVLVNDKTKADFELSGVADTANPGWAKQIFMNSDASNENASISLTNLKTGQVVWAYSVHKGNSYKGKQSAGEACGKHLKEKIESKQ